MASDAPSQRAFVAGPVTMLFGYALLGLQPLPVRALGSQGWTAPWVVMARFGLGLVFVGIICLARRRGLRTGNAPLLFWRGLFGGVAVLLYFSAVQLAGVGTATVLNYTYPLWANVLAVPIFKQRVPAAFWVLLAAALAGVWLIVDPTAATGAPAPLPETLDAIDSASSLPGATDPTALSPIRLGQFAGVASAVAAGAAVLCIKKLRETDESLTILTSFSLIGLLVALPFALFDGVGFLSASPPAGTEPETAWTAGPLLLAVGFLAFAGHFFFTRGYKFTSIPLGSSLSLTVPVIAAGSAAWLMGERLSVHFTAGALLVLAACGGIAWISAPKAGKI